MADLVLSEPRRLSEFVALLHRAPSLADIDRFRAERIRSLLDTRQAGDDTTPLDPDALATALTARDMAYARLALPQEEPQAAQLDRFGDVVRGLPKPLIIVSPIADLAGLFAMAHIAIEQGMTGEAMLERAEALNMNCGTAETRRRFAVYVNERKERLGQHAVAMHAEGTGIAHPLRSTMNELPVQIAAGASVIGLLGALLVDRRLLILSLVGAGYLAQRMWPLISRPVVMTENVVVPQSEVDRLRQTLDRLKTA